MLIFRYYSNFRPPCFSVYFRASFYHEIPPKISRNAKKSIAIYHGSPVGSYEQFFKGGLVIQRHNEIRDCIGDIASQVWTHVIKEPVVREADVKNADGGLRRGIDAVRIYILGLGFRALGRAEGARDQVNLHPESESSVKNHPSYTKIFSTMFRP